jgi:hypothetical protein
LATRFTWLFDTQSNKLYFYNWTFTFVTNINLNDVSLYSGFANHTSYFLIEIKYGTLIKFRFRWKQMLDLKLLKYIWTLIEILEEVPKNAVNNWSADINEVLMNFSHIMDVYWRFKELEIFFR